MKYLLFATINIIYGVLLLLTLSADTPGFLVVLSVGAILVLMGLSGLILWLVLIIRVKKGDLNYDKALKSWFGLVRSFDIVLVIGLILRSFIIQPFIVDGSSMEINFHDREAMLVDKISYRFEKPKRGDVIIFQAPQNPGDDYIKRVIGLPGEEVSIITGKVYINNELLTEKYLTSNAQTLTNSDGIFKETLGANEYFVMGDNRSNSSDSRSWGPVPKVNIVGRAWLIVYPLNKKGFVKNPNQTLIPSSAENTPKLVGLANYERVLFVSKIW